MPKTYILIDSSGKATMIPESDVERIATERMVSGQSFQIYRAEPMQLQVSLTPAAGAAPVAAPSVAAGVTGRKKARKAGRKKAGKRASTRKTTARRGKGTGKVGRPPVNIGPCTVAGCTRSSKTRGLCSAHYQQHRRLVREKKPGLMAGQAASTPETVSATKKAKKPSSPRRVAKRGRPARKAAAQTQAKK